tara:strand:+ start:14 stop:172 length:159 start_codon:yes stop_codon:yes gene_type:complete
MKKYKYFYAIDKQKEVCGTVKANDVDEAFLIASITKHLNLEEFKKIFNIEKM